MTFFVSRLPFLQRAARLQRHISLLPKTRFTKRCLWSQTPPEIPPEPPELYEFIDGVEPLSGYERGEYHPVHIDDRLNRRYRIVYKLGWGSYSTTWLALDEETNQYVSVKVGTTDSDQSDSRILSELNKNVELNRGLQRPDGDSSDGLPLIPTLLDRFDIHGPNGRHPCTVTPPTQCSVWDVRYRNDHRVLPLDVARSFAAQVVMAVAFLHSQGYAHGHLHTENLLLTFPLPLNGLSVEQLYARYRDPEKHPYSCPHRSSKKPGDPGLPKYATPCVYLGQRSRELALSEANLILNDFGAAFRPDEKDRFVTHGKNAPIHLCAPELLFEPEVPLTCASDIWSLACVIYELVGSSSLFGREHFFFDVDLIQQHIDLLGDLPPEWVPKWVELLDGLTPYDMGKDIDEVPNPQLFEQMGDERIQRSRQKHHMQIMSTDELEALLQLLRRMLEWKPSDRISINDVLETEWMTKWALPTYRRRFDAVKRGTQYRDSDGNTCRREGLLPTPKRELVPFDFAPL